MFVKYWSISLCLDEPLLRIKFELNYFLSFYNLQWNLRMMMKGAVIGKQRTPSTKKFIVRMIFKTILCRVERRSQSFREVNHWYCRWKRSKNILTSINNCKREGATWLGNMISDQFYTVRDMSLYQNISLSR